MADASLAPLDPGCWPAMAAAMACATAGCGAREAGGRFLCAEMGGMEEVEVEVEAQAEAEAEAGTHEASGGTVAADPPSLSLAPAPAPAPPGLLKRPPSSSSAAPLPLPPLVLLSASASRGVTTGRKSWEGAPWGEGAVPAPPPSAAPAVCGRRIVAPGDEGPAAEAEAGAGTFSWPEAAGAIVATAGVDMGSGKRAGLRRGDGDADADADAVSEGWEGGSDFTCSVMVSSGAAGS